MARYRNVQISFWTDTKVLDDFTPEDRYFFLYLMTNPHTNLSGCYEISIKQVSIETGYATDVIYNLLDRFENTHDIIRYSKETKEVLIVNWSKFNWTKSKDFIKPLLKEIENIKNVEFKRFLMGKCEGDETVTTPCGEGVETVSTPCGDGVGTTVTVPVTDTVTVSDTVSDTDTDKETISEIVNYLNEMTGQKYKSNTKTTVSLIRARLKEGFDIDDFKTVIYKKTQEWKNEPKMAGYLRPQTLFGTKFESYLNQVQAKSVEDEFNDVLRQFVGGGP